MTAELDQLREQVATLIAERDKARADYAYVVERIADQRLDGYRELGECAAAAEKQCDALRARITELEAPPVVPEGCSVERLEDGRWWASRLGWLLTSAEQAAAYRALAWAIEHDQRPPHAGDER